ncbi:MAG: hypothetical protein ACK46X_20170 [Candidatus Sericytochromatia bacterium]
MLTPGPQHLIRGLVCLLALPLTAGCELMAMGPLMSPGILPGVGFPIQGIVRDARTHLPIGGATVASGLGATVTDAEGRYSLYGNMSSREISVSRAGYQAQTMGGLKPDVFMSMDFTLDPIFALDTKLPMGFLDVRGSIRVPGGVSPDGLVSLSGKLVPVSNGAYSVRTEGQVPGKVTSTVMAGGRITGAYEENPKVFQPFNFETFGYQLVHLAVGDNYPAGQRPGDLVVDGSVEFRNVRVSYTNLGGLANVQVQTTVELDFGVAGYVTVAQATGSNQLIKVPKIDGVKYVVRGQAFNEARTQSSAVTITTTDPSQAPFQMLTPPKVLGPTGSRVGARPTFKWAASTVPGVVYQVTLSEGDEGTAKWQATTTETEITYPSFSLADVNGGALRPDKKYNWSVRVIDVLATTEEATNQRRSVLQVKPLRSRQREAMTGGLSFSL